MALVDYRVRLLGGNSFELVTLRLRASWRFLHGLQSRPVFVVDGSVMVALPGVSGGFRCRCKLLLEYMV